MNKQEKYASEKLEKTAKKQDKKEKLAAALRDNLRRRKIATSSQSKNNGDAS